MNKKKIKVLKLIAKTIVYAFACFGILFILMLLGVLSLMGPKSRLANMPASAVLNIDFNQSYAELRQDDFLAEFTSGSVYSVFDLVRSINVAATDDKVKAISANLNITNLSLAQIEDISEALKYFQSTGKKIYLFSNTLGSFGGGTKEYYLASLFDEIWMQPNADIGITGVNIEVPFFKNILNKIGVEPEFYTRYEYKTAVESLLNAGFSKNYKQELEKLASGLFDELSKGIARNRKKDINAIKKAIDNAPIFSQDALQEGLIDKLDYRHAFEKFLKQTYNAELFDITDYMGHIDTAQGKNLKKIAFLVLDGVIDSGESSNNPLNDTVIGCQTVLAQLQELASDKNLKALVLRINSPGGSYTASDEIRAALVNLKQEKNIPIVVSMSTYAASGGYFVSLAGDYIMAEPSTITGSIGVLGGKMVFKNLFDKLSINWGDIKYGKNAGILSFNQKFTPSEREVFNRSLDLIYADFTEKVSSSRGINLQEMDSLARGRVWLGPEAQKLRLVDELGGIQSALLKAKELANITSDDKFTIEYYPRRETFQERLTKFIETGGNLPMMKVFQGFDDIKVLRRLKYDATLPPFVIKM